MYFYAISSEAYFDKMQNEMVDGQGIRWLVESV